ncbi:hypothetical protein AAG570_013794 [Ranatra chinensis]|uniref:Uncharacterized protein n=1 Tax=Ranatra chinensis TaxID=642074 RepID=A0ABD0YD82_9HEMI
MTSKRRNVFEKEPIRELYYDHPQSLKAENGVQALKHVLPEQEAGDDGNRYTQFVTIMAGVADRLRHGRAAAILAPPPPPRPPLQYCGGVCVPVCPFEIAGHFLRVVLVIVLPSCPSETPPSIPRPQENPRGDSFAAAVEVQSRGACFAALSGGSAGNYEVANVAPSTGRQLDFLIDSLAWAATTFFHLKELL